MVTDSATPALSLTSCPPPSCLSCHPWWPGRPGSPWHFEWLRCWDPHQEGSLEHSEGTRGPASRRNHPPPEKKGRRSPWLAPMCPWLSWHRCLLTLPGQTLRTREQPAICSSSVMLLRSGSPERLNSCWLMVIFSRASSESRQGRAPAVGIPASAAEAAAARRASSSCRCRCSSIETRPAQDRHWDPLQTRSHWHQDPAWRHLHQPESGS
uniref:Uncharacterized protein n=1 Tax=Oryctolagus cuniculus TaxID=9986 RepID=A0A5F9CYR8_RABIT